MTYTLTAVDNTLAGISVGIVCRDTGEESIILIRPSLWNDEGLSVGDCFGDEDFTRLCDAADLSCAIARAEGMLASSDYSRQRLISRLMHHRLSREICEKAADYMVEKGYINEEEQAKRITRFFCLRKHWGKKRIAAELMGRGYNRTVIFTALDTVSDEEYFKSLMSYIAKKYPQPAESPAEEQKRIAALSRLGYSLSEIHRALTASAQLYKETSLNNE